MSNNIDYALDEEKPHEGLQILLQAVDVARAATSTHPEQSSDTARPPQQAQPEFMESLESPEIDRMEETLGEESDRPQPESVEPNATKKSRAASKKTGSRGANSKGKQPAHSSRRAQSPGSTDIEEIEGPSSGDDLSDKDTPKAKRKPGRPPKAKPMPDEIDPVEVRYIVEVEGVKHRMPIYSNIPFEEAEDKLLEKLDVRKKSTPQLGWKWSDATQSSAPEVFDKNTYADLTKEVEKRGHAMKTNSRLNAKAVVIIELKVSYELFFLRCLGFC